MRNYRDFSNNLGIEVDGADSREGYLPTMNAHRSKSYISYSE